MKRKEYYWIGRFICLLGYLFLAVKAVLDPWVPADDYQPKSGELYNLLNCWIVLIPIGFLIIAIASKKKANYACAILTILISLLTYVSRSVDVPNSSFLSKGDGIVAALFVTVTEKLQEFSEPLLAVLIGVVVFGMVLVAAIRGFSSKRLRIVAIILSTVTIVFCAFYIVSLVGIEDNGTLLSAVRNGVRRWSDTRDQTGEITLKAAKILYAGIMVLGLADIALETFGDCKTNKAMR